MRSISIYYKYGIYQTDKLFITQDIAIGGGESTTCSFRNLSKIRFYEIAFFSFFLFLFSTCIPNTTFLRLNFLRFLAVAWWLSFQAYIRLTTSRRYYNCTKLKYYYN